MGGSPVGWYTPGADILCSNKSRRWGWIHSRQYLIKS